MKNYSVEELTALEIMYKKYRVHKKEKRSGHPYVVYVELEKEVVRSCGISAKKAEKKLLSLFKKVCLYQIKGAVFMQENNPVKTFMEFVSMLESNNSPTYTVQ